MAWRIELTETVAKQLSKLGKAQAGRITQFLRERVVGDPRGVGRALTGPLGRFWRYRVGDDRVICDIKDGAMRVLVVKVGGRGDVYR